MAPDVSVVIATRDRVERLRAAIESLRRQTLSKDRFEVIVVDDGSKDDTAQMVADESARGDLNVTLHRRATSGGPGAARNDGWRAARAPVVAFIDDDCEAEPEWLEAGLAAQRGHATRFVQGATSPNSDELDRIGPFSYTIDNQSMTLSFETCNIFYPRALLEELGGFDTATFPAAGEDTDLAWRAIAAGAEPGFEPRAHARHAVVVLGPLRFLRRVWSWHRAMPLYARHPELRRRRMVYRIFWSPQHVDVTRTWIALLLPWRWWLIPFKVWLARVYVVYRLPHPRTQQRSLRSLLWFFVADTVEVVAAARGSIPTGRLVL